MKTKLGLLFVSLSFTVSLVFVPYGYGHKTLIASRSAAPLVSFEDYSKMENVRDRKAALARESPYAKSMLWRQHLAFQQAKMELNAQQKDFLRRVSQFLDEDYFATPINLPEAEYLTTKRGQPFKELMADVKKLFTREQSRQLFLTIGDTSTITDWGCRAATTDAQDSDVNAGKVHGPNASELNPGNNAAPLFGCDCSDSLCGSGCGSGWHCAGSGGCSGSHCGCFGMFECTGGCEKYPEIQ